MRPRPRTSLKRKENNSAVISVGGVNLHRLTHCWTVARAAGRNDTPGIESRFLAAQDLNAKRTTANWFIFFGELIM